MLLWLWLFLIEHLKEGWKATINPLLGSAVENLTQLLLGDYLINPFAELIPAPERHQESIANTQGSHSELCLQQPSEVVVGV